MVTTNSLIWRGHFGISTFLFFSPSLTLFLLHSRMMYLELMASLNMGTPVRDAFDKALQALPITQHEHVWNLYLPYVQNFGVKESAVRVYRRYIMFDESKREEYTDYLLQISEFEEGIRQLAICVNDDNFSSPSGQSKHQMWMKLCDLCANHPEEASKSINVDAVIRSGINRFSDEIGKLWCRLANYYTRMGQFERSRDVYEEGINSVITIRDFTIIFDSYVKFEEGVLTAKMRIRENDDEDQEEMNEDVELRLARLEYLLDKRPMLLNAVALRQNPHNVVEWHKRIKLVKGDARKITVTYAEALKTVDPRKSTGKVSGLWLAFASYYDMNGDLENARALFKRASEVEFRSVEELAQIWCAWGELELKHGHHNKALDILQQAVTQPIASIKRRRAQAVAQGIGKSGGEAEVNSCRDRLYKSVSVWSLYLDLEETFGSTDSCRAAYEKALDLKVITPQMVLNYAAFLEERNFYEDSFKVFERAIALFTFPHVKVIWNSYLDSFLSRYEGSKIERLRDLFEQAVSNVPQENAAEFYIKYAKAEESYGLLRHAMSIYDRATRAVAEESRLDMYRLYIKKVEQHYGLTKTRPIYELAVSELNDDMSRAICLEFADMECKLGEIDRARMIFVHGSQFGDPRREMGYWKVWREFEEAHGNEETFREMLRIQRSVEAAYSQANYLTVTPGSSVEQSNDTPGGLEAMAKHAEDEATNLANQVGQKRKFVPATTSSGDVGPMSLSHRDSYQHKVDSRNPDEISLDTEVGEASEEILKVKSIPSAVFGSLAT